MSDAKYGEVVGAWIVREPGAEPLSRKQIRDLVSRNMNPQVRCYIDLVHSVLICELTSQNAPAWVWFMDEDGTPKDLPKTASGKVQKHILRKWSKGLCARGVGKADLSS